MHGSTVYGAKDANPVKQLIQFISYQHLYNGLLIYPDPSFSMDSRQKLAGMTNFIFPDSKEYYILTHRFCGRVYFLYCRTGYIVIGHNLFYIKNHVFYLPAICFSNKITIIGGTQPIIFLSTTVGAHFCQLPQPPEGMG